MKPVAFDYYRPEAVAEAVGLLAEHARGGGDPRGRHDARPDAEPQHGSSARRDRHFTHARAQDHFGDVDIVVTGAGVVQCDALRVRRHRARRAAAGGWRCHGSAISRRATAERSAARSRMRIRAPKFRSASSCAAAASCCNRAARAARARRRVLSRCAHDAAPAGRDHRGAGMAARGPRCRSRLRGDRRSGTAISPSRRRPASFVSTGPIGSSSCRSGSGGWKAARSRSTCRSFLGRPGRARRCRHSRSMRPRQRHAHGGSLGQRRFSALR